VNFKLWATSSAVIWVSRNLQSQGICFTWCGENSSVMLSSC